MKILKRKKGITLVALIITIIILLILAGVSLSFIFNDGVLDKTQQAANEYKKAETEEKQTLEIIDKYIEQKLDKDSEINENSIVNLVKVGDYVDYNPTISDNLGTPVNTNKLVYSSPKGDTSPMTNGNGNSEQIFTATADIKWRILTVDKENKRVELISENPIDTDNGDEYILEGGIGYLYAEKELNEICKIYGYGYGADTSLDSSYIVGGPFEETVEKIEKTGARSISIDDINKIAGVYEDTTDGKMKDVNGSVLDSNYGRTDMLLTSVYYPTITSTNTENPGTSSDKSTDFKYTFYEYGEDDIKDNVIREMLFNDGVNYWLASRCISIDEDVNFCVRAVTNYEINAGWFCNGNEWDVSQDTEEYSIRPIVTINGNIQVEKDNEKNVWILK